MRLPMRQHLLIGAYTVQDASAAENALSVCVRHRRAHLFVILSSFASPPRGVPSHVLSKWIHGENERCPFFACDADRQLVCHQILLLRVLLAVCVAYHPLWIHSRYALAAWRERCFRLRVRCRQTHGVCHLPYSCGLPRDVTHTSVSLFPRHAQGILPAARIHDGYFVM